MFRDSRERPVSRSFQRLSRVPTHDSNDGATLVNEATSEFIVVFGRKLSASVEK
jgi:hypothetical protein